MRFSEFDSYQSEQLDFVPRERQGQLRALVIAFAITIGLVFVAGLTPAFADSRLYSTLAITIAIGLLCVYVVYRHQTNLDIAMAAEYQSMLYAQAFSVGTSFAIIVRRDGTIIHASDTMSEVFPRFDYAQSQALEGVFQEGVIRRVDRERIMGAIYSGQNERLIFPVFNHYQEKKEYIISVEPMTRPAGYCLIRGREYLGQRAGMQLMPDALRSTSVDKIDHLLATVEVALYTTDAYGRFEYVNPAFEQLFGYEANSITEAHLAMHHLVFSLGTQLVTDEYSLQNFSGPATLLHKSGSRMQAPLHQVLIRDAQGKAIGATGSILPTR